MKSDVLVPILICNFEQNTGLCKHNTLYTHQIYFSATSFSFLNWSNLKVKGFQNVDNIKN